MIRAMSAAPPPAGGSPPGGGGAQPVVIDLGAPSSGVKRLMGGRKDEGRVSFTPQEIAVEHGAALQAPLRFAPGSVIAASVDPGAATVGKDRPRGRFPILHRLAPDRVIPREAGIEGWVWTSTDGSAFTVLGDAAPNLAFVFSPPLSGEQVESAFTPDDLADLAKRSPLGQPAVFGLLVHVTKPDVAQATLERYQLLRPITDRDVPPTQRRHLADDQPANPTVAAAESARARTSVPPPGMG
jgi:hypothetical protein